MMRRMLQGAFFFCMTVTVSLLAAGAEQASAELVVDVTFHDGRKLTVHRAEILKQSNPGYVPARYTGTDRIVFSRSTTSLGVTQTESKPLLTRRIRAIQYGKNKLNWCLTLVSLADGTVLALEGGGVPFTLEGPTFVLERLSDENRQELAPLSLSTEFAGYRTAWDGKLAGEVGKNPFHSDGTMFSCPSVFDEPGGSVEIRRIELRWIK